MKQFGFAGKNRTIVSDVVKIAISAADGNVERRPRCQAQDWREAHFAEIARRVKASGKNKAMSTVQQAARPLAVEVSGYQSVGSIDNAVVRQMRKCVSRTEGETKVFCLFEALAKFEGQAVIEAIAGGDYLLDVCARRIRSQFV